MEVLIIGAFISIVGAVSVPTIMGYLPNMRLKEGGRLMFQTLQQARMEAIKRNAQVALELKTVSCGRVNPISSGSNFQLSYKVEEDEQCKTTEKDGWCSITGAPVYLSNQVAMCTQDAPQENPEKITFKTNGQPADMKEMAIRLRNSAFREVCVNLTSAGTIHIKDVALSKKCIN